MKKKSIFLLLAAVVIVAMAGASYMWWQKADAQFAVVSASLPAMPDLSAAPAMLRERIGIADTRARTRLHARNGLAELSALYHANGYLNEATLCYEGLEQLEPAEPRWLHRHAAILAGYGEIEPALALWHKTAQLAPDYIPIRLRIGDCEFKSNRLDAATAAYEEVLRRSPSDPYALLGLARIDFEAQRWEKARERLETVVKQTNYLLGYDLIVSVYERLGLRDLAAAIRGSAKASGAYRDPPDPWLDELIDVCLDPYRLSLTAGVLARNGESAKGVELLRRAVEIAPDDVSSHFQLGNLYVELRDTNAGREQLERCTTLAPTFSDGWARLSALLSQTGDQAGAERALEAGLRNCPQSPGLHLMLARNLRKAQQTGEAINEFLISIRLRPNEPDAYIELGDVYIEQGRVDEGMEQMRAALETDPANPVALSVMAFNAISTGNNPEARKWLERVADQPRIERARVDQLVQAYRQQFGHDWKPSM